MPAWRLCPLLIAAFLLAGCDPSGSERETIRVASALGGEDTVGYQRAIEPRKFEFPRDHGPHPGFRNEWWYLTGNLETRSGRRFGFQVTFFRIALAPTGDDRSSRWATRQIWMGHAALSDFSGSGHSATERFAREAVGLAGAQSSPFRVWIEDWRLESLESGPIWQLAIDAAEFSLNLKLKPAKPPVLQGDQGLSRKSATPGNASYYYSLTRLETSGEIRSDGGTHRVEGLSWLDREWSTNALDIDQVGWDWFALHLDDGRDLMYYQIRDREGHADPQSGGSVVGPNGSLARLRAQDIDVVPVDWWRSPAGRRYPIAWHLHLRSTDERFDVEAVIPDQEMDLSVRYWEGAVNALEAQTGKKVGRGYLELTGY